MTALPGLDALPRLVAHAGAGSTWQSLLTAVGLGLLIIALLVVAGRMRVTSLDDLVVPLASVAVLASLAPLADYWLSDWVGWAFPAGVVVLIALVTVAVSSLELHWREPFSWIVAGVAIVAAVLLYAPITRAWHPPVEYLPASTDAQVEILVPEAGADVEAGTIEIAVAVSGGSIGPGNAAVADLGSDPEEAGGLSVFLDGERVVTDYLENCTIASPCERVSFPIEVKPGAHELSVEFTRGDGMPLAPQVTDRVEFEAS